MTVDPTRAGNNFGIIRLALATLVVLSHAPELLDGDRSREILSRLFGTLSFGEFAVDGFFLVSGYLITLSCERSRGSVNYLAKRVLRIYPGFVVAFLVSLLVAGWLAGGALATLTGRPGIEQIARMLTLQNPALEGAFARLHYPHLNGAIWTIAYEFRCYVLTLGLGALGLFRRRALYLGLTLALLALHLSGLPFDYGLPDIAAAVFGTIAHNVRFFGVFCVGGCFYLFRDRIPYSGGRAMLAALGCAATLFVPALAETGLAVFGGYALFWFSFHAHGRLLRRLDPPMDISYGLYLYAWPVQNLIIQRDPAISPWVLFALSTAIAAAIGLASWVLVERPCLALKSHFGQGARIGR